MTESNKNPWHFEVNTWDRNRRKHIEAITVLGNGYFATRGAYEESVIDEINYPGTYIAGGFNRLPSDVSGKHIEHESMVNCANWLPISFKIEDSDWFSIDKNDLIFYRLCLDLKQGLLIRRLQFRDSSQRESQLEITRLVHMRYQHMAAISWKFTPMNWSGILKVSSALDGNISNLGVNRYQSLNSSHLDVIDSKFIDEDIMTMTTRTNQSHIIHAFAARTKVKGSKVQLISKHNDIQPKRIEQSFEFLCEEQGEVHLEKLVSIYDSKSFAISEPCEQAVKDVNRSKDFETLAISHKDAWRDIWEKADLKIDSKAIDDQLILRLHIFHLLQTASLNTIDLDAGIPARGLHGEAYRGHIFWDEIFIFPFLNLRFPELTRAFLMYRYRRLDEARYAAQNEGFEGAMFPWQSGSDGREESQTIHLNPLSGHWLEDKTHRQRHVNAAIAYNIWQYTETTGDFEFLSYYGAEVFLEIAKFFASIATFNPQKKRYDICGVVGPDEYHTGIGNKASDSCKGNSQSGLINNSYTNVMASWVLKTAMKVLKLLSDQRKQELFHRCSIGEEDLHRWRVISRKLYLPIRPDGIVQQFEGWEDLKEIDWNRIESENLDPSRIDRILEANDDDVNDYKITKQADLLMLFFLFSETELKEQLNHLRYVMPENFIPKNIDYYNKRTSHGSSLSRVVFAWVLARINRKQSWSIFQTALNYDLYDSPSSTTSEGIHLGAMAGTIDIIQRCYTGLKVKEQCLYLDPRLPEDLTKLVMHIKLKGSWLSITITSSEIILTSELGARESSFVIYEGENYEITPAKTIYIKIQA